MTGRWQELRDRARCESKAGRFTEAAGLYDRALKVLSDRQTGTQVEIELRVERGHALSSTSAFSQAIDLLENALAQAIELLGTQHALTVRAGLALGTALFRCGRVDEAGNYWQECQHAIDSGADVSDEVRTMIRNNMGGVHYHRGEHNAAIRCFEEALAGMEARLGQDHVELDRPLGNLAWLTSEAGRPLEAERLARRALAIAERARGPSNPELAPTLHMLANILSQQDRLREAIDLYRRARAVLPESHYLRAYLNTNLADVFRDLGDLGTAGEHLDEALRVAEDVLDDADPVRTAIARAQAYVALAAKDHGTASMAIARAFEIEYGVANTTVESRIANRIAAAEIALEAGRAVDAERSATEALRLVDEAPHLDVVRLRANSWRLRASARSLLGKHLDARRDLEAALETIEDNPTLHGHLRRHVLDTCVEAHEAMGDRQAALHAADAAVVSLERSRLDAYALLETRNRQRRAAYGLRWFDRILRDDTAERRLRMRRVESWFAHHQAAASAAAATVQWYDQATDEQRASASAYRAALRALASDAGRTEPDRQPGLLRRIARLERTSGLSSSELLERALGPVHLADVAAQLEPEERFVAMAWLEHHVVTIHVGPSGEFHCAVVGRTEVLAQDIQALRAALQHGSTVDEAQLLRLALAFLEGAGLSDPAVKKLTVVPDGIAALVPWARLAAALRRSEGHRPIHVDQTPSVRTFVEARRRAGPAADQLLPPQVIADPDFGAYATHRALRGDADDLVDTTMGYRAWLANLRLPRLFHARAEAEVVKKHDPSSRVIVGAEASVDACLSVKRPRILHIATHGFVYPGGEDDGGHPLLRPVLALAGARTAARTPEQATTQGFLPALAMAGMDLQGTELVFLSACDTSLGAVLPGEGVAGMPQALITAGARCVIACLWRVPDDEAVGVARSFYQHLGAGATPSAALNVTQRAANYEGAATAFVCWT